MNHINKAIHNYFLGGFIIKKVDRNGANSNLKSSPQAERNTNVTIQNMKEEISLELAELGNLKPKHEPMTPNQREKSEREKSY